MIQTYSEQDAQVRHEHWKNLVNFLRLRFEKLEKSSGIRDVQIDELFDNEIYVRSSNGVLSVWLEPKSGNGSWNAIAVEQTTEPWSMSVSGSIELHNQIFDIESAANFFAMKLTTN